MAKKITLKFIAQHFNVSIATVSKSLKNSHEISVLLREKIQNYAQKYNYRPNAFAQNLKNKQTKSIGIIIPNILNLFFAKVFSGIEKIANEQGYNLVICITNDSYQKEVEAIETLINGTVDGLIVSIAEETQKKQQFTHFEKAINKGIRTVMIDRITDDINCDKVVVDDKFASFNCVNHLIKTGHTTIALLSAISDTSVSKLRIDGYKQALKENNIAFDKNLIIKIKKDDDIDLLLKISFGNRNIDALLCLEETSAVAALEFSKHQKYKIPEDISIIGFTNGELTQHMTPSITTVSQHGVFMGECAMIFLSERLAELYGQGVNPRIKVIKTSLIERETTLHL